MHRRRLLIGATVLAVSFPIIALASPVEIPNAFEDGNVITADEFNENFAAIADAVNDNDARIAALEAGTGAGVPTGTIAFFATDICPDEWDDFDALRGRMVLGLPDGGVVSTTVGTALDNEAVIEISEVPSHTHVVDPPNTTTFGESAHTHQVNPPAVTPTTTLDGDHRHTVNNGNGGADTTHLQAANAAGDAAVADSDSPIGLDGAHTHDVTVDIGTFASLAGSNHVHDVNIGPITSAPNGGAVESVDVTMPYIQLLACVKL